MMEKKAESEKILALERGCQTVCFLLEKKAFDQMKMKNPEHLKAQSDTWIRWKQESRLHLIYGADHRFCQALRLATSDTQRL